MGVFIEANKATTPTTIYVPYAKETVLPLAIRWTTPTALPAPQCRLKAVLCLTMTAWGGRSR